jgi:DNA-binding GntR family transcriptional regulator
MDDRELSLGESVYIAMKDDILTCRLAPGDFVTEADLAKRYGVSKTPIREAISHLSQEGFIQSVPRRGTLVRPIEMRDIQQTYLLRGLLEPPAAALAAEKASNAEVDEIRVLVGEMTTHDRTDGLLETHQARAHRRFHSAIAMASGIPRLGKMVNSLHEEVERFMNANPRLASLVAFGDMDHQLLDAIANRDAEKASDIASESVEVSRQSLIAAFMDVS